MNIRRTPSPARAGLRDGVVVAIRLWIETGSKGKPMADQLPLERVARAICRDQYQMGEDDWLETAKCWRWELFRTQARAAVSALQEPSKVMLNAGLDELNKHPVITRNALRMAWSTMLGYADTEEVG
jgi:hypothetical protein